MIYIDTVSVTTVIETINVRYKGNQDINGKN